MALKIYNQYGVLKVTVEPTDNSTQNWGVMSDNELSLSFTLYEFVALDVNDYVDFLGSRYWLAERFTPKQKSTIEWTYDIRFYGIESLIKRFLVLHEDDPEFSLTAPAREHVALIVKGINNGMGNITDWKVGNVVNTGNITIDYTGLYCDEGLREAATQAGVEWWVEGQTINLCRCEHGEELTLAYNKGLTSIERDTASNVKFYTRLFPIGSTRNIDPGKYGHARLQLPGDKKYVDINVDKYGIIHHYEKEAFSGIYPRRVGIISSVRTEEVKDSDGNPYTIYYFKDSGLNFDPNSYEIGGLVKQVTFESGELLGRDCEVNFNSKTGEFEIITTWPYNDDTQVPGGLLIPKAGDSYVLWNVRMPNEYYSIAEWEFKDAVEAYNAEHGIDVSVYKCPTDYIYIDENNIDLFLGRRVRLESREFFPELGYRNSRITKITRKVNRPSQVDLEISDAVSTGTLQKIQDNIASVKNYAKGLAGSMLPDIIRTFDNTYPTDNNLFSARRTQKEFLSKQKEDTAQKVIRFLEGIDINYFSSGKSGARVDGEGNAELQTAVIRELLRSTKFVDGMFGEGWRLWIDKLSGLSNLTIDKVTIRQSLVAMELLIEKVRSIGGQFIVSAANGKIKAVEKAGDNYIITFEQDNTFVAGALMRCAVLFGTQMRGYWVEVAAATSEKITVPVSEFGGAEPLEGDECVLMGNTGNPLRQNLISISATEDGQPRVDVMDGICGKNFNDCLRVRLGNLDGINDNRFPLDNQPHGNGLYGDNVYLVGTFLLTTGEDILTKFEIVEGKISSAVEGLRTDFTSDKSYLDNASFGDGLNKWDTENEATFFLLGNRWIWANDSALSSKTNYASVRTDEGRTTVFIRNKYILQKRENFRSVPEYKDVNLDGKKIPEAVYLSFFYKCTKAGRLQVNFEGSDKTGFENFNMFAIDEEIAETDGYVTFNRAGLWNGTGDFKLSFTGDIYLYMLILSTDRAESLAYKYKTLFEQSEKLIRIAATNFDKNGVPIQSSQIVTKADMNIIASGMYDDNGNLAKGAGLVTTAEANKMFAFDKEGNLVSFIDQTAAEIKIKASQITFEGLITANSYFKILNDGSIEAENANIKNGKIGGFLLANGRIGTEATAHGSGGGLAIYDDFFRVGGSYGYVMMGDDVIPASAGGAFTATGRIVNNHPNSSGMYGFDQANYGLFISVSGGTKNYGISSDAALMAPGFINTKAQLLTFGSGNYEVDFSQRNIILMYYNQPNYSGTEVTLPSEASVARQFGMRSLPNDFATVVTFRVRTGSKNIILMGIYDHNEGLGNYTMAPGDSVTVLITKVDGFRYQILNHSY